MKLIKFLLIATFATLSFSQSTAQPAATKTVTYNLCYPDNAHPLNNALLTNLMSALPRVNDKPCITFEATFSFKYRVAGSNFRTEIFCDRVQLAHPLTFQRFDLSDKIFPVTAKVDVKIDEQTKSFEHQLKAGAKMGDMLTPDQPQKFKIEIVSVQTGQEVLSRIVEKQQHISAYYTADTQIKLAFEELSTINPDSLEMLDQYLEITRKNFAIVDRIKKKELYKHLNLGENDPLNVYDRTNELHKANFEAKNALLEQTSNLGEEYLRLGLESLNQKDTATALEYFNTAIEVDSMLAGPYVEKAKIDFNRGKLVEIIDQIRFISAHTTHHSGNREDMVEMIKYIESQLIDQAEAQNKQEHYHEALTLMDSAEHICNSIQVVVCSDMINVARSHSWRGLLNQHIINWFDIISRTQYSELPNVVEETFQFRKDHNKWLTTNELLYTNMKIVQDTLISVATKHEDDDPEKALEALYAAREICNAYVEIPCAENLDERFKVAFQKSYKKMLNEAEAALQDSLPNRADTIQTKAMRYIKAQKLQPTQKHREIIDRIAQQRYALLIEELRNVKLADKKSITLLDSALTIRKKNGIDEARDENFQRTRLLTDYVTSLAEKAERMLRAEQIVIATELVQEIDWVLNRFNFVLNDSQQDFVNKLREKIGRQACYKRHKKLSIYTIAAEKFMVRKDYPHAQESFEKALTLIKNNPGCGFNAEKLKQELKRIADAAAYQRHVKVFRDSAVNNNFESAIAEYDVIKNKFNDSLLKPFDLEFQTLANAAQETNYLPFMHHAAKVLAERGQPNESFGLITVLYKSDFDYQLSKPAQEALGASLAKEFYIKDPSDESAQLYEGYVIDKKWSKPFKKAFKRQWKIMQTATETD